MEASFPQYHQPHQFRNLCSILKETDGYNFQWETVQLLAIEILLPICWENGRFQIKGDLDLEENKVNPRTLFIDRSITYRLRPDKSTYSRAFMIGTDAEDSDQAYDQGIIGNGSGQGDILIRFDQETPENLFYFCPDQAGAGGPIEVKSYDDLDKPNQRQDFIAHPVVWQPPKSFSNSAEGCFANPHRSTFL